MLDTGLVIARGLLVAVFGVAGAAKLADRTGSHQALVDFGVGPGFAVPLSLLLPLTELVVALALLPATTAWFGAVGALALLVLFVAAISVNLARGRTPACRCFGRIRSEPVGWRTVARNALLAGVAGVVLWQGPKDVGPSVLPWLAHTATAEPVLSGAVLGVSLLGAETWVIWQLLRQHGRVMLRLDAIEATLADRTTEPMLAAGTDEPASAPVGAAAPRKRGLPVGTPAPGFTLPDLDSETVSLDALRALGKPTLLFFTDPACGSCDALLPDIGRWQREQGDTLTIALVSRGSVAANRAKTSAHAVTGVLLQREYEVADAYQAQGTPAAVLVHPDGRIATPVILGAPAIRVLVTKALASFVPTATAAAGADHHGNGDGGRRTPSPAAPKVGPPTPVLVLVDLDGRSITLADSHGSTTLVLFWNPGCGFCQRMLPDLKRWEAHPPKDAPRLIVVSAGTVETNRAQGLRCPIVLDEGFHTGLAFGARGTPSAVLVDSQGKIASEVVVGADAVLALARGKGAV